MIGLNEWVIFMSRANQLIVLYKLSYLYTQLLPSSHQQPPKSPVLPALPLCLSPKCHMNAALFGPVHWIHNCEISYSTWMQSNTFLDWLCVGDLLCRDVTDKERGGSKPLSSVMHFPFDSAQQPLNLIFQHFSPWALCSVFSCGMCWRTQLI